MQTNKEIRELSNKIWNSNGKLTHNELDILIGEILSLQKQQMIEKGEGLKKPIVKGNLNEVYEDQKAIIYNQTITDYQNLIKE
ncbi:MAG: hypothetical protein U0354_21010 [Candidatus Sericytochromatia bacterium]